MFSPDDKTWLRNNSTEVATIAGVSSIATLLLVGMVWLGVYFSTDHPGEGNASYPNYPVQTATPQPPPAPKKAEIKPVYAPPCGPGSDEHGCNDVVYGKRLLEGTVDTVRYYGDEPIVSNCGDAGCEEDKEHHLLPDYTEVVLIPPDNGEDQQEITEKFCGNQLDKLNPGQHVKRVIKESSLSDYNGCYTVYVAEITFGGKSAPIHTQLSTVPGSK